jgi:hypothetical protein
MTIMTYEVAATLIAERLAESDRRRRFARTRGRRRVARRRPARPEA